MQEYTDRMTRLRNEKFLDEFLPHELGRCVRYGRHVSFLLLEPELENKGSTDVLYPLLKKIANYIRNYTRFVDISIRIGRQILIIMVETDIESAKVVENKLKNLIEKEKYEISPAFPHVSVKLRTALGAYPEAGREPVTILKTLRDRMFGFGSKLEEESAKQEQLTLGLGDNKNKE
ncbi:MAG: diguanylate cyclase [Candidatus Eremiobacteraeota bacterium]|nr:diguanylate cyclase [Candidatus Eremiobacteraeota bacterium]